MAVKNSYGVQHTSDSRIRARVLSGQDGLGKKKQAQSSSSW